MTDLFLERYFERGTTAERVIRNSQGAADCMGMHKVVWNGSFLSMDGRRLFCWFTAPDQESARIALRQAGADYRIMWRCSIHEAPGVVEEDIAAANVLVERSFEEPVTLEKIQDIEDAGFDCLDSRNVRFIRTFFSHDRKRMICLYEAPDAESVRQAQREAGVPFNDAWSFEALGPADLARADP